MDSTQNAVSGLIDYPGNGKNRNARAYRGKDCGHNRRILIKIIQAAVRLCLNRHFRFYKSDFLYFLPLTSVITIALPAFFSFIKPPARPM